MFGRRYWGRKFFGPRFWGSGGNLPPPPTSACEYFFTNFEANAIGTSPPSGWTNLGPSATHDLTPSYSSPPFKRRVATVESPDATLSIFSADAVDAFNDAEDADVVVMLYRPSSSDHDQFYVFVRGQGAITDGYQFVIDFVAQEISLLRWVSSAGSSVGSAVSISHPAGEWRAYRFRVNGSTLRARVWETDDTEPTAWAFDETDGSPVTAAGWIGMSGFIASGTGSTKVNFFSVACGGCSAYMPVLNTAFRRWLESPAKRCLLGDMPAVGYDSVGSPSATKTVYARIANMGFTTGPSDDPPNFYYRPLIEKIPTLHREMNVALAGRVVASFGALVVNNKATKDSGGAGERDDWQRIKWKRNYLRLYWGDPSWTKHDFRPFLVGRLGQPKATAMERLEFLIADLADIFNELLQENKFASGPNINRSKPLAIGAPMWVDLPVIDQNALTFQMNDGPLDDSIEGDSYHLLYDDGRLMAELGAEGDSDATANTMSLTGAVVHGYANGYVLVIPTGSTVPGGLAADTRYYLRDVTTTTWKLAATPAGSAIDITTDETGVVFNVYPYQIEYTTGVVTLQTQPASSRITAQRIIQAGDAIFDSARIQNMLAWTMFTQGGIDEEFKDTETFDALGDDLHALHTAGVWMSGREQPKIGDAVERITNGSNTWYGVSPDGLIQVGLMGLPQTTAVASFTDSHVKAGSLRITNIMRPVDFSKSDVTVAPPWLEAGPLLLSGNANLVGYQVDRVTLSHVSYGAAAPPLDSHPDIADAAVPKTYELIYVDQGPTERNRMAGVYLKALGVFEVKLPLRAMARDDGSPLCIGDTIELVHPRLGWRTYDGYDPQSPDNDADFDATKAVVIGIDCDLSAKDPFPVTLTVYRQIPGYYPTEDLT